jgi:3-oxoadipate enol-lactonase
MKILINIFFLLALFCSSAMAQIDSSGYLDVGNDEIFYEAAGEGPVLVLLHNGLVHREIWEHQFSFFSQNYRVIRYDRRGYGNSSPATEADANIGDLNSLFTHLKIDKACLMGMSSGGRLAIDLTLQYPEKVSALVLVGAVVGGFPVTQHMYNRGGHLPSDLTSDEQIMEYYALHDPYEIFHENKAAREKVAQLVTSFPQRIHDSARRSIPKYAAYRRLHEIRVPTLILVGEFDIPDVHAHAGAIHAGIPGSKRDIIPKAGHLIPMEQPTVFNTAVQEFLEAVPASNVPGSPTYDAQSIRVPEGNGQPVLLDGHFSPGEWEQAQEIDIHPNVRLYLKKYRGHIFIGIKITSYQTSVVDMFISPDGKNIHHLHTSAQIGERLVNENSGPWDNPSFIWGNSNGWYANEIRWDNVKMQDLMKQGKDRDEAQEMSYFKYDGFEFQIKQSKFSSDQWLFRIEVPMAPDFDKPVIFPEGTEMKSTKNWVKLELK